MLMRMLQIISTFERRKEKEYKKEKERVLQRKRFFPNNQNILSLVYFNCNKKPLQFFLINRVFVFHQHRYYEIAGITPNTLF